MPFTNRVIIVPVDFSGESSNAVRTAVQIADGQSRLHLVHVLLALDNISPGVLLGDVNDEQREAKVKEHMQTLATENGAEDAMLAVQFGDPGLQITDYAANHKADLIVIPSHGYHGIKRLVMGSVAERVIRHAACSVLVLRRTDAE